MLTRRTVDPVPSRYSRNRTAPATNSLQKRYGYDVLLDAGTPEELARYFRYSNIATPAEYGLEPDAKDPTVVAVAETNNRLIVTHDTRMDRYVHQHQKGKKLHRCLRGLVLLPSGLDKQIPRLRSVAFREKPLIVEGVEVFWYDVWNYNLFVNLRPVQWPVVWPLCECGKEAFQKHFRQLIERASSR